MPKPLSTDLRERALALLEEGRTEMEVVDLLNIARSTLTRWKARFRACGQIAPMTISGGTSGDVFVAYLEQVLIPTLKPGDIVAFDNLGAHHDDRVRPLLRKAGVSVLYLPPYSPEFDPLEEGLSSIKWFLKSAKARTQRALQRAIAAAIETITPKDAIGWFQHAGYLVPT